MDFKLSPVKNSSVRPFILVGGAMSQINLKGGAKSTSEKQNAYFSDWSWRIGTGIQIQIKKILLEAEYIYNPYTFTYITLKNGPDPDLPYALKGVIKSINLGIGYVFK
jgi:hypothetical protein